ncbi:MAG: hypothetical protein II894_08200 [Bacteroidales bacterium]|nr:hypothetical protein [Bacteroidales bacterium]
MKNIDFNAIDGIIKKGLKSISLPFKQRAKFEGWLKIELAAELSKKFNDTRIEPSYPHKTQSSADIFSNNYYIELKTVDTDCPYSNTVDGRKRFSNNITLVLKDINKLRPVKGIVAFILFPYDQNYKCNIGSVRNEFKKNNIVEGSASTKGYYIFVAEV